MKIEALLMMEECLKVILSIIADVEMGPILSIRKLFAIQH